MYRQTHRVAFNEMDQSARELADTIVQVTRDVDRNNLVIMCGEEHSQLTHRFFAVRLMHHLNKKAGVATFFEELGEDDISFLHGFMPENDVPQACCALTELMGGSVDLWLPAMYAARQKINVCFMDLPISKMDGITPYVAALDRDRIRTPRLHEIMERDINVGLACRGDDVSVISYSGAIRRDVFMADMICTKTLAQDKMVVALNGNSHLADKQHATRPTLVDFLVQAGKEVICVSCCSDSHMLCDDLLGKNIAANEIGRILASFRMNMPDWRPFGSRITHMWQNMMQANGLGL